MKLQTITFIAAAFVLIVGVLLMAAASSSRRAVPAFGGEVIGAGAATVGGWLQGCFGFGSRVEAQEPGSLSMAESSLCGSASRIEAQEATWSGTETAAGTEIESGTMSVPASYVIYINWDGFAYDYYKWANGPDDPGTPALNFLASRGALFTGARNGFPGITNPMQTSIVTGAWPAVHGNTYRYYDPSANLVRQTGRNNAAETIAEAVASSGLSCASVQQFMLDGRGTYPDDPRHLYIQPGGPWQRRVSEATKILRREPVASTGGTVTVPEIPRLLAIYADDLDAAGHNSGFGYGLSLAFNYESWKTKMVRQLAAMDAGLGLLVDALKDLGIFDRTAIVLTSDHGMSTLSGKSSLPDLLDTLRDLGYKCELLPQNGRAADDTQIVLVSAGLAVQFYFRWDITLSQYNAIIDALAEKPYMGGYMSLHELKKAGAHPSLGSLLVWPKPPHHFRTQGFFLGISGQHDSGDETSRHVFMMLSGAGVRPGVVVDKPVEIIDVAPTIAYLLGVRPPANATGRVLTEALLPEPARLEPPHETHETPGLPEPNAVPEAPKPESQEMRQEDVP